MIVYDLAVLSLTALPILVHDSYLLKQIQDISIEKILELCGAGISVLKTSNGVSVPLYAEKYTSPALHIRYNGQVCYANLTQGKSENAINIRYGGVVYHVAE